ncbi:hypothetical protein COV93_00440 [Candidatus Woesearchaeota archaeon CG11_big_fil_rev_8_21_14_0_20_43_8]|nr:MAG: hypothetical protein COV93_00440 [Candidatus Woesearchaeota archaeon CG11_big_fil_rev_8_21_14_0_20_43_8]PIO06917.1 MAG: hypothetical protein COT47_02250 [Candidatus Woesearchaeota archaeon CG08_land_8_20_14_0_20_43_7]
MDRLSGYIQHHLTDYIKRELDHGYSLDSVKDVLLNYHHHNIVDEAIKQLKSEGFSFPKKKKAGKTKMLDKRLFLETVNLLQDYIIRQKKRGYKIEGIKEALTNYGHSKETVKAAIDAVEYGVRPLFIEPFDYGRLRRFIFPISLVGFFIFTFWLAASVDESLVRIIALFFPTILTIFLVRGFFSTFRYKQALLAFPLFLILMYYLIGSTGQLFFEDVELVNLSVLNAIFAFMYSFFFIGESAEVVESEKEDLREAITHADAEALEEEFGKAKLSEREVDNIIEKRIKEESKGLQPIKLTVK